MWECWLKCLPYNIFVFSLSLFDFIGYYRVSRDNLTLTRAIKYLVKSIELWLLNYSIREVSYNNKSN
jgi:hypothetical protein